MLDAGPIIIGWLFVLLQVVGAVGGTVVFICTLAACFWCFQSQHLKTPNVEIAVVVQGRIHHRLLKPRTIIAQALVQRLHSNKFNFKLLKQAALRSCLWQGVKGIVVKVAGIEPLWN